MLRVRLFKTKQVLKTVAAVDVQGKMERRDVQVGGFISSDRCIHMRRMASYRSGA